MPKGLILVAALLFFALGGGGGYWYFVMRPNQPDARWVQAPAIATLPREEQKVMLEEWEKLAADDGVMRELIKHTKTLDAWEMSEEETLAALRKRIILRLDRRTGLHVGFKGKRKQREQLNKLSQTFFQLGAYVLNQRQVRNAEAFASKK